MTNDKFHLLENKVYTQSHCYGQYSKPVLAFGTERMREYDNKDFSTYVALVLFASKTSGLLTL